MRNIATSLRLAIAFTCVSAASYSMAQASDPQNTASAAHSVSGASADNSRINARDKGGVTDTPQQQSNSASDRKLLAAARRSVEQDKALSVDAHNVKIMAANGVVTLRGPVKTYDEKNEVEARVRQVAGVSNVNNQLDVKTN